MISSASRERLKMVKDPSTAAEGLRSRKKKQTRLTIAKVAADLFRAHGYSYGWQTLHASRRSRNRPARRRRQRRDLSLERQPPPQQASCPMEARYIAPTVRGSEFRFSSEGNVKKLEGRNRRTHIHPASDLRFLPVGITAASARGCIRDRNPETPAGVSFPLERTIQRRVKSNTARNTSEGG